MKKTTVLQKFDNSAQVLADRLGYAHRNIYYNWPDVLTDRILADVVMRMKAKRIKIPPGWEK